MAFNPDEQPIPYQSESLAHGGTPDPNDVGGARFYYDKETGQYMWGFPTYRDGRQYGVNPVNPGNYDRNGMSEAGPYRSGYRFPQQQIPASLMDPAQMGNLSGTGPTTNASQPNPGGGGGGGGNSGGIPGWLKNAASALPIAAAAATGGPGGNNAMSPELQQLLAQALKRMSSQDGLFAAVNKQAMAGLPTIYQQ